MKKYEAQHCIRAIADEVIQSRSVYLLNFGDVVQVITLNPLLFLY